MEDGLGDRSVTGLAQDSLGYIWIATDAGLDRFDGHRFLQYWPRKSNSAISSAAINKLSMLNGNRLAVGTRDGLHILNTETLKGRDIILQKTADDEDGLHQVWDIVATRQYGYIISDWKGFYMLDSQYAVVWQYTPVEGTPGSQQYGREILKVTPEVILGYTGAQGKAKLLNVKQQQAYDALENAFWQNAAQRRWVGKATDEKGHLFLIPQGADSLYAFNAQIQSESRWKLKGADAGKMYWPAKLFYLNDTLLALAHAEGGFSLIHFQRQTGNMHYESARLLPESLCRDIMCDRDGRIWVATQNGLYKQRLNKPPVYYYSLPKTLPGFGAGQEIHATTYHAGKLWLGLGGRGGIVSCNPVTLAIEKQYRITPSDADERNEIFCLQAVDPDTLWAGTRRGLIWLAIGSGKTGELKYGWSTGSEPTILSIFVDSRGQRWMGVADRLTGIVKFNPATGAFTYYPGNKAIPEFPLRTARNIIEDPEGNIWFAHHGLARFHYTGEKFDTVIHRFAGVRPRENNIISLANDKDGFVWLITTGNGLLRYHPATGAFFHYNTQNGLTSNLPGVLSLANNKWVVIAGRYDIQFLNKETQQLITYRPKDGLPSDLITSSDFTSNVSGDILYAGFGRTLAAIAVPNTENALSNRSLVLSEMHIVGDTVIHHPSQPVTLSHNQQNLVFRISQFDFEWEENLYYRLNPKDPWVTLSTPYEINLNNLNHGTYVLEVGWNKEGVIASSKSNRWEIIIKPPWWQHPTFYLFVSLLTIVSGIALFRWRLGLAKHKVSINEKLADYEMKALHAQMNPHFVFNSLNSIKDMILLGENDEASKYLNLFASLVRLTLSQSMKKYITLQEQIEYIEKYLKMESIRFPDIRYKIELDDALEASTTHLPPMMLQPLVENAIWHGLRTRGENKLLDIQFVAKNPWLECRIMDNGIGMKTQKTDLSTDNQTLHMAINNITHRLQLLNEKYHLTCSLDFEESEDMAGKPSGTIAILKLPLNFFG